MRGSLVDRFWPKVERRGPDECWPWTAGKCLAGYGAIRSDAPGWPMLKAHRVSYEIAKGPIPEGLVIDHICENKACVNPAHLEPVTAAENSTRYSQRRTHCRMGHALTPDNLVKRRGQSKQCRVCHNADYRSWRNKPGPHPRQRPLVCVFEGSST